MIPGLLGLPPADLRVAVGAVLSLAVGLAVARLLIRHRRAPVEQRSRDARIAVLVLAQPVVAALLYVALFPPTVQGEAGTMLVVTADATPATIADGPLTAVRVALPGAPAHAGLERVPDLATARRRHPGTRSLRIIGRGLMPRDQDAARGLAIDIVGAPLPQGLVELHDPGRATTGSPFPLSGRTHGLDGGAVELLDPAGRSIERVAIGADGRFTTSASAHAPGSAKFRLRLRDARRRIVETIDVPVLVSDATPPRVLLLAAAPGPEIKYLRRWMQDARLPARSRIDGGGGLAIGDARLDAATLARTDVVVVDDRTWAALGDGGRATLRAAVRGGLGLLIRLTGPPMAPERRRLAALGFALRGDAALVPARVVPTAPDEQALRARLGPGTRDAPRGPDTALPEAPVLSRRDVQVSGRDSAPLLRDVDGTTLGAWRAEGRGRIGLLTLVDSHRLVLAGRDDVHGDLWSAALATLARAAPAARFRIEGDPRPDERVGICAAGPGIRITAPDGRVAHPLRDPARGADGCAAFWPSTAGFHRIDANGIEHGMYVRRMDEAKGLRAHALQAATLELAAGSPRAGRDAATPAAARPGPRWPWWLAWLTATGALWWFERARIGRRG